MNIIKKTKQMIILMLLVAVLFTISGCDKLEEKRDVGIAEAYVSSTYGNNYQITGYEPKKDRASGLSPARVKVAQNGIDYYVDVLEGQVAGDNYSENYAGKIVYNYIEDCMKAKGTNQDASGLGIRATSQLTTIADRTKLLSMPMDFSSVQNFDELKQAVDSAGVVYDVYFMFDIDDSFKADSESWLYDFYLTCQEELDSYSIIAIVKEPSGKATAEQVSFGNAPYPNVETLTEEEFFARFN